MVSSLIPPKIATPSSVSGGGTTASMDRVIEFYTKLPKGRAPNAQQYTGLSKFVNGKNATGKPIVALVGGLFVLGYTIQYFNHLRYHKNAQH
ncbi:ATPeFF, ATP17 [Phaffia rhodozyma]|uniref:ATPeFF, ATP17 n=1 Tax=Phaffia rhodozyma TaxID=264483 RepID=A0A0F7SUQ4_PHARH|nr:ATPeFF, ATP17 [Phaffia rhodozyma]